MKLIYKTALLSMLFTAAACDASDKTVAAVSPAKAPDNPSSDAIIHDADYYVLEAQHAEKWASDDKVVDKKLAEYRDKNGGKSPNLLYILVDDMGFGDMGIPELNGYACRHGRNHR